MSSITLARLRAKTDRELAILVTKQLERSRNFANAGDCREAADLYMFATQLMTVTAPDDAARLDRLRAQVRELVELPLRAIA
jgi:hypothetical protein